MRVAVVDIGSNSIKLLVAERGPGGSIAEIASDAVEARISAGIGSGAPSLGGDGMERGIAAATLLVSRARSLGAVRFSLAATSAVRDASNGAEFREGVRSATGLDLRVLTGLEEANLIGRGLTTDPLLADLGDFRLFDLGGGSLECLSFRGRRIERAASMPLGCVRLTEKFVPDPSRPFSEAASGAVSLHVKESLRRSVFTWPVPPGSGVVGTGGTLTTVRAMLAAEGGVPFVETNPRIGTALLGKILSRVAPLELAARRAIPGLPAARADVFPTALATLLALAELGGFPEFRHSLRNLRWGIAAEMLE